MQSDLSDSTAQRCTEKYPFQVASGDNITHEGSVVGCFVNYLYSRGTGHMAICQNTDCSHMMGDKLPSLWSVF